MEGVVIYLRFTKSSSPFVQNILNDNGPCLTAAASKKYFDGIFQPIAALPPLFSFTLLIYLRKIFLHGNFIVPRHFLSR